MSRAKGQAKKKRKATRARTPIRRALHADSVLQASVADSIGAIARAHRNYLAEEIRAAFGDSLDLDAAMREGNEQANRWDYLLGHANSEEVIALEPHSARDDQIRNVIAKKDQALQQLREHLRNGVRIVDWIWVASGNVQFVKTEAARLRLAQHGIRFVGRQLLSKHLPGVGAGVAAT